MYWRVFFSLFFCTFCVFDVLSPAVCSSVAAADIKESSDGIDSSVTKPLFDEVSKLVKMFYPNAKVSQVGTKIHFEFKAAPQISTRTHLTVIGPKQGGILGDVEVKKGSSTIHEQIQNEYYYQTILLAPYSAHHDCHLQVKLSYPPETSPDFVERFKGVIKDFGDSLPAASKVAGQKENSSTDVDVSASSAISTTVSASAAPIIPVLPQASQVFQKPKDTQRKLFFWKAKRGSDVVYLLGTIHAAPSTLYPLPREIESAFDSSRCLLVEVNIEKAKIDPEKIQQLVNTSGKYTAPDKLSKHLSPGTKRVFEAYLSWAGESWAMYEQYKPWYTRELISVPRRGDLSKMKKAYGIDLHFLQKAAAQKKPVEDFETVEFQLALDSKLSEDVQDKLLQVTLLELKDTERTMASIFDAWKSGDMEKMEKVAVHESVDNPDLIPFTMALLNNRNVAMAAKIDPFLKTKGSPLFVAVGSAHMVGESGLVNLLKKKGFEVEQVTVVPVEQKAR